MKKTDAILQFLDDCEEAQSTSEVAAGIDQADDTKSVGSLLSYLKAQGRVRTAVNGSGGVESTWLISAAGKEWFADLKDEAAGDSKPAKVVHQAQPKVQRKTAKVQPAKRVERVTGTVEPPALPAVNGARQIAVRDDGAVLVLEHDVVVTTLHPDDARRIALVVQRLLGAPA